MQNGFVHSVRVPRLYKAAADIVQKVQNDGASLKTLIFEKKHPNVSAVYALTSTALQKRPILDILFLKTNILTKEPRLSPWLARVLITELLWGKGTLKSECKPVQVVLTYEKELRNELEAIGKEENLEATVEKNLVIKPRYVRVNTLILPIEQVISNFEREGWTFIPRCTSYSAYLKTISKLKDPNFTQDFHIPEMLVFPYKASFYNHSGYINGELALQDKASCLPSFLLNPPPGSTVLDMCAAPGMKTSHLAAIMNDSGTIYATEKEPKRYMTLCSLIEKMGCTSVKPMNADALTLTNTDCKDVEYILVDPSCSGSGMTDRHTLKEEFSIERLSRLQSFQVFLLRHALLNFPTVKKVVYSTCSITEDENEKVIDEILTNVGDAYRLVPGKELMGDNWINFSNTEYNCGDKCLYARTETDFTNGFFVAVFERNFDVPLPEYKRTGSKSKNPEEKLPETEETVEDHERPKKKKKRGKKNRKNEKDTELSDTIETAETETETTVVQDKDSKENSDSEDVHQEPPAKKMKGKHKKRKSEA